MAQESNSRQANVRALPTPPKKILVVDDNVDAAESLAVILRLQGHTVRAAHDGMTALDVAIDFRPNVVVLDIGLPKMHGYEVARRLRLVNGIENALLIAVTGYGTEMDIHESRAAGIDQHLVKPIDIAKLEVAVCSNRTT